MELGEYVRKLRIERGMSQVELGSITGEGTRSIGTVEREIVSHQSTTAKRLVATLNRLDLLTSCEKNKLNQLASKPINNSRRIPNIPNFYERLKKVTNAKGNVDPALNPEVFDDLQKDLGVYRVAKNREAHAVFGRLIREYRGRRTQREVAKLIGVSHSTYSNAERGRYNSDSHTIQSIVNSKGCYTANQKVNIKQAYRAMQKEEEK